MSDNAGVSNQPDQIATKLSINPLVLESAKITLATTGIDLSTYIEASLRQLVQKNAVPFEITVDSITWANEESIRRSVNYVTSGLYFEAQTLVNDLEQDLERILAKSSGNNPAIAMLIAKGLSALRCVGRIKITRVVSALTFSCYILKSLSAEEGDCHLDDNSKIMVDLILNHTEIIKQRVVQFLSSHSMEIDQTIDNSCSSESESTVLYKLDLFDSLYAGVLECFEQNPERFTSYFSYYNQKSLLETIKGDLAEMYENQQDQQ